MWNAVLDAGKKHKLMVIAPAHHRRIQAGILSWGQDMDHQHNPFQCNLGYQVSLSGKGQWSKESDYIGKEALEKMKSQLKNGEKPYKLQLVGLEFGGKLVEDYANDFWLISNDKGGKPVGFIAQELGKDIPTAEGEAPFEGTLYRNVSWEEKYKTIKQYLRKCNFFYQCLIFRFPSKKFIDLFCCSHFFYCIKKFY